MTIDVAGMIALCSATLIAGLLLGATISLHRNKNNTDIARIDFDGTMKRIAEIEKRIAGVEALVVESIGQNTRCFCEEMENIMNKMSKKNKGR